MGRWFEISFWLNKNIAASKKSWFSNLGALHIEGGGAPAVLGVLHSKEFIYLWFTDLSCADWRCVSSSQSRALVTTLQSWYPWRVDLSKPGFIARLISQSSVFSVISENTHWRHHSLPIPSLCASLHPWFEISFWLTRLWMVCGAVADCTIFDQYGNRQRQHHQSKGWPTSTRARQEEPGLHSGNTTINTRQTSRVTKIGLALIDGGPAFNHCTRWSLICCGHNCLQISRPLMTYMRCHLQKYDIIHVAEYN